MITRLLPIAFFFLFIQLSAQQKLKFSYDTAGNQILRDRVCITCLKAYLPPKNDSIIAETSEMLEEEIIMSKNFGVVVYPNPVTNVVYAEWQPNAARLPVQLLLFSMQGGLLAKYIPKQGQVEVEIDTTPYAPGMYILEAVFNNGEQKSFKVMKE